MSDTPETDQTASYEGSWDTKALRMTAKARSLEQERDEARKAAECLRGIHYEPAEEAKRPFPWSSIALLAAWREYSGNPYAMHPCENFKAGWVARKLTDETGTTSETAIKNGCREFRC